jgi:hypothetical protein
MARRPISLDTQRYNKTLVRRLCPLVNVLRDLVVRFGLRGYSVRLVKVRWTGNRVGLGVPGAEQVTELLPTPKLEGLESLSETADSLGNIEVGSVTLTKINPLYTEEFLRGCARDGTRDENLEVFYEIVFFGEGTEAVRRRFHLSGTPRYGVIGWQIELVRAHENRSRGGLAEIN